YIYLSEIRDQLKGTLTLTAVSDEETGGEWGTGYLMEHHPNVRGDCVINAEPSSPGTIRFGETGPLWLTMRGATHGGHGAYDEQHRNDIIETAQIIPKLQRLTDLPVTMPPEVEAKVEAA